MGQPLNLIGKVAPGATYTAGNNVISGAGTLGCAVLNGTRYVTVHFAIQTTPTTFGLKIGSQALALVLNGGSIAINTAQAFTFLVSSADPFDFQFGATNVLSFFYVSEEIGA